MILLLISIEAAKYCNCIAQRSGASQLVHQLCHHSSNRAVRHYQIPLTGEPPGAIEYVIELSLIRVQDNSGSKIYCSTNQACRVDLR